VNSKEDKMGIYTNTDIHVDASGDITLAPNGDFQMADPSGVLIQDVAFRARTDWYDFEPHPRLGADLQRLIGEPNTKELGSQAEDLLYTSLTFGGLVAAQDLKVKGVPISNSRIALYSFINATNYKSKVFDVAVFDYEDGIINAVGGE
jgi:hypothetical protein